MGLEFLVSVIIVGILATFLLFIMGLWAHRLGMPRLDLARGMVVLSFGDSFKDVDPFRTYWPGVYILFMNGIFFAFVYAAAVAQVVGILKSKKGMSRVKAAWKGYSPSSGAADFKAAGVKLHKAAIM